MENQERSVDWHTLMGKPRVTEVPIPAAATRPGVFVYKDTMPCPVTGNPKFVCFHADDILTIEQVWGDHATSMDVVERKEAVCVTLKAGSMTDDRGHLHLDVKFNEIMMRWTVWKERNA